MWKTPRKVQVSWTTPVLVEAKGRTELVTNGTELIIGYDPATGKELWRAKGVESNAIHTPLVGHGLVIFTAGYPAKKVIAIRPGGKRRHHRHRSHRVDLRERHRLRPVADPLRRLSLSPHRHRHHHVPRREDAAQVQYEGGRPPEPAKFMGSPVAWGGNLYLTSLDGDTFVIKAGPKHEVVRTNTRRRAGLRVARAVAGPRARPRARASLLL